MTWTTEYAERARREFASRLALMREEATRMGLFATAIRLDAAVRMVGFEIAGDMDACERDTNLRKGG